jgi:hypothetical protein
MKIKPCPWCGCVFDEWQSSIAGGNIHIAFVECPECFASGPQAIGVDEIERYEKAVKSWNRVAGK